MAGRSVGVWRTAFYYYLTGLIALSVWLLAEPNALYRAPSAAAVAWIAAVGSGLLLLTAVVLFTQGLVKGEIAIVAPVTASYGAVTTLLSMFMGERFSAPALLGLTLTIAGASLVALPISRSAPHLIVAREWVGRLLPPLRMAADFGCKEPSRYRPWDR
jgi:drug/metabolite transporter (DMT)-like permease